MLELFFIPFERIEVKLILVRNFADVAISVKNRFLSFEEAKEKCLSEERCGGINAKRIDYSIESPIIYTLAKGNEFEGNMHTPLGPSIFHEKWYKDPRPLGTVQQRITASVI